MTPGAPKTNPSAVKWSPKASPDPLKSIKKRVQDHPRTPLRKRTSPRCENPIIYYVFEVPLCENPIIYYVFSTSKTLIFLKSNENLIIYYVLELPKMLFTMFSRLPRNSRKSASPPAPSDLVPPLPQTPSPFRTLS